MTGYWLLSVVILAGAVAQAADPLAPTVALPAERYAPMAAKSPFALATVTIAPETEPASLGANWQVIGMGRVGSLDFVVIKSRDGDLQFSILGRETHPTTGISVVSVDWSEVAGKSSVTLRKGSEVARLEFNEAVPQASSAALASAPVPEIFNAEPGSLIIRSLSAPGQAMVPRQGVPGQGPR
jgi:hypothetical protein